MRWKYKNPFSMAQSSLSDPIRLAAVKSTQLVDTPPQECFDRYTRLAQRLLRTEMAIVSLVLEDRQFYKSCVGLPEPYHSDRCSPIEVSLCKIGVERRAPVIIRNGPLEPEFCDHPAVRDLHLNSYLGIPLFDDSDQVLGTLCVANHEPRDWTDEDIETLSTLAYAVANEIKLHKSEQVRQRTLESARNERDLLDCILDTSIAAITLLDTDGTILFCNRAAENVLGLSVSDVAGRTYDAPEWRATAVDGGHWPDEANPFRRVLATGNAVHDIRHAIEWPNGQRRILSVSGAPLRDKAGTITRLVFLVNDITEQHTVTQRLTQVAQQFGKSFCLSPNWVMLCRYQERTVVEVSGGLMDSLKIARSRCIDRRLDDLGIHFSRAKIDELFNVSHSVPQSGFIRLRLQATDQQLRLIEVRSQLIEVGNEQFLSISGQDLTEQRAEKQRRALLEQQLREAQKAEIAGQLAGGLAHDFNNILTAIIGNSELASQTLPPGHPAQRSVGLIKKAGQRAAEQIRQILALSRKEQTAHSPVEIRQVIEETASLFRSQNSPSIQLKLELPAHPIFITGNAAQIDQILVNLLNNARHAMADRGEIEIRLIEYTTGGPDDLGASNSVVIEIEDNGAGIDPMHLPLVFEPFFTTKDTGAGAGIGLALARTIARSFSGDLTVDSQRGSGATFRLRLPRDQGHAGIAGGSTPPMSIEPPLFKLHILLVDDNQEVLITGRMVLEQLGHKVEATLDPEAALESLSARPKEYDLIVTDNLMPRLTGIELIKTLRQRGVNTPVILVSGYGTAQAQIENMQSSRACFVPKPFTISELSQAISHALTLWISLLFFRLNPCCHVPSPFRFHRLD